jgi:hypothetical protein
MFAGQVREGKEQRLIYAVGSQPVDKLRTNRRYRANERPAGIHAAGDKMLYNVAATLNQLLQKRCVSNGAVDSISASALVSCH